MLSNLSLWQRISAFKLDGAADEFPFSARLGRENGWPRARALRAIEEYKRFIYLICVADFHLTPSEDVDQVWHLHLVYTRSYWTAFCDGVLGRRIHHEPTKGGQAQTQRFGDQYEETCSLYEKEFGAAPPIEFWPSASERFATPPRLQWIDRRRNWIVAKPAGFARIVRHVASVPLVLLAMSGSLQAEAQSEKSGGWHYGGFILFAAFFLLSWWVSRDRARNGVADPDKDFSGWWWGSGCSGGGCSGCGGCGGCGG